MLWLKDRQFMLHNGDGGSVNLMMRNLSDDCGIEFMHNPMVALLRCWRDLRKLVHYYRVIYLEDKSIVYIVTKLLFIDLLILFIYLNSDWFISQDNRC